MANQTIVGRIGLLSKASGLALMVGLAPVSAAMAQTAPAPPVSPTPVAEAQAAAPGDTPESGAEITVTASRVNREGYEAPTPTVVVGAAQLENRATTNIGQFLNEIPAFRATTQPTANGITARTTGSHYVDLRGLGTSRTLVLVNGNRFVPEMAAGLAGYNVNLNQIPAMLVDRIEIVTGGASAQWGSDAVAGVVNILLKKNFSGFQAEVQGGTTTHDDYHSIRVGAIAGTNFGDGRGNITIAADFEKNYGVGDINNRDWGRKHIYLMANPCPGTVAVSATCPTGGNGLATNLLLPDVQFSTFAPGGVITNTALRGTQFGPGGVSMPFVYGQYVGPTYMSGGGQPGIYNPNNQPISAPYQRLETYARASYEIATDITAHAEASFSYSKGGGEQVPSTTAATIRDVNPYIPADIRTKMTQLGITNFSFGRYGEELTSTAVGGLRNRTKRVEAGLEGKFGDAGDWKWSVDAGYGINQMRLRARGLLIATKYAFAADAVIDPATGKIVCNATLPGPSFNAAAAGCVPINLFGQGSITTAAHDYVTGTAVASIDYKQSFANTNLSGKPFSTWAGPVSVAVGAEIRHETEVAISDPVSNANGFSGNNSASFSGKYDVKEVYGEVVLPILKDSPIGRSLELNGAVRYADYSGATGGQTTWKAGATYRPFAGLLLRGARSRDIRAPNIFELNLPPSARNASVRYGITNATVQTLSQGNPNLHAERADTTTFGFSYQPPFVPGLAFSVDRFKIATKGLISTLSAQDVTDLCAIGKQQSFCQLMTFNAAGVPTAVLTPYLNLSSVETSGFDFQASYRFPLDRLSANLPGTLQFSFAGTLTQHSYVNSGALGAPTIDRAGEDGPRNQFSVPRFRSTMGVAYSDKAATLSLQARHISGGLFDNTFTAATISDNHINGRTYFDLSGSYDITSRINFFAVVNNLFDRDPPPSPNDTGSPINAVDFDTIGRVIKAGVRIKM